MVGSWKTDPDTVECILNKLIDSLNTISIWWVYLIIVEIRTTNKYNNANKFIDGQS